VNEGQLLLNARVALFFGETDKFHTDFFTPLCREQTNTKAIMIAFKFIQKGDLKK
jgi:hypothetical protein